MIGKVKKGIIILTRLYCSTPFYPHWLEFKDSELQFQHTLNFLSKIVDKGKGRLLEIGCGSQIKKSSFINKLGISFYCGLDFPVWISDNVQPEETVPLRSSFLSEVLFGDYAFNADVFGDTHFLPFANESFDYISHFGTMEHVNNINQAFSETIRCLKKDGILFFSIPFLYQEHGYDISRLTRQGMINLCENQGMEYLHCYSTGFGTTLSQLCNSFLIKNFVGFYKGNKVQIILGSLITFLFFPLFNITGLIINRFWKDPSYANNYYYIFKKIHDTEESEKSL